MSIGTPGFEGSRLREAREARGLSGVGLAELIGKTSQAIYKYELNLTSPQAKVLDSIADVLRMPLSFFTLPARVQDDSTVFYRSMSAVTKRARKRAGRKLKWLQDITLYLNKFIEFPVPNLPELRLPSDPSKISNDDIDAAATNARRFWKMSDAPIGNMTALLENQGVIVAYHQLGADKLDGLSRFGFRAGRPYIIVGTDKGSAVRWRFDVAHELGHLLLHPDLNKRELARRDLFKLVEQQAHRFARSFLLPLEAFGEDLFAIDLEVLRSIKPKWKVSIAAMIMRSRDTGLLSEESDRNLWIGISRRHWRQKEPFDDEIRPEEPRVLRRAIELILANRAQTVEDISTNLSLSLSDIEGLAGLPSGYFKGDFTPVQMIQPKTSCVPIDPDRPPAEVISFPIKRKKIDQVD